METNDRTKEFFRLLKAKDKKEKTLQEIEVEEAKLESSPNNKKSKKSKIKKKKAYRAVKSDIRRIEDRIQNEYSDLLDLAQSPGLYGLSLLLKKRIR